jgi:uncharacterized membrane protein YraQ (UPF0718 family)
MTVFLLQAIGRALYMAAAMGWKMLWALILGVAVSGVIQAVVSRKEMARLLPDARAGTILKAAGLGAASSSCSYAATAIARSIVKQGGDFTAAMAFQFASTNLVLELGLILWSLLGWRFTLAQFAGGFVTIALLAVIFRLFLRPALVKAAVSEARSDVHGKMEGHAEMDMSVADGRLLTKRLVSPDAFTAISHFFVSDAVMLWGDIGGGLLISGAVAAWVPASVWSVVFATHDPLLAKVIGPLVGPLVAIFTFVCSVGNVPLAAVLWNSGSSFGGVIAFLFADLIVLPILDIYRRYYGWRMALFLLLAFYVAMALSAYVIELTFNLLHLTPVAHHASGAAMGMGFAWDYTTWLNLALLAPTAVLIWRFLTTGGPGMLRMMEMPSPSPNGP